MMNTLLHTIRILVTILLIKKTYGQDGFNNGDLLGYQQMASNDGQTETITGYSTNIMQSDPISQSVSSINAQYHITDDSNKNTDYSQVNRGRSRKIYRIKNPFHSESEEKSEGSSNIHDTGTAANNQYAAQYAVPPEGFLQQMRAENQYYQQQSQLTTPASNLVYTATPQPQHQFSTIPTPSYDTNSQQSNQFKLESKIPLTQSYLTNSNYQYNPANTFGFDPIQSTPSPINLFLSTAQPNQYVSTPGNSYVSSSSPIFLSSPTNLRSYVSSSLSPIQATSPDYNNRITSTISSSSLNFENSDSNRNMQIDHYDNSANGFRYPMNIQQQYQNIYPSSTSSPSSTSYSDIVRENWQSTLNAGINALSKSLQEVSLSQYQSYPFKSSQQEVRSDNNFASVNSDTHRMEIQPSANNIYLNYAQPDYQTLSNIKSQTKDSHQNINQQDKYTNGDYGWKLNNKKTITSQDSPSPGFSYPKYTALPSQSEGGAVSQMNFHMDTGTKNNFVSHRTNSDDAKDITKGTAQAHEHMKHQHQLYGSNYPSSNVGNSQLNQNSGVNPFYINDEKKRYTYIEGGNPSTYSFSSSPPELITASPFYTNSRDIAVNSKVNPSFDHAKALQNIVAIDVSNVVPNNNLQSKLGTGLENNIRYNIGRDYSDQTMNQYYHTFVDSSYKDKNKLYGFHLKTKPEDFYGFDNLRQSELNAPYIGKQQQSQEITLNPNSYTGTSQSLAFSPQGSTSIYQDNIQSPANFQHQELQRLQNQMTSDIASLLKLNDGSQQLQSGNFGQGTVPSSLPVKLNQNLNNHQLDVNANVLSKLMMYKQPEGHFIRPELESISNINGFKVANPYNVDLRLVAELLKGKSALDEPHFLALKDQLSRPAPIKLDLTQLQPLLRNENSGSFGPISDSVSAYSNPYIDVYGSGQYPYQGVKYSRSQEEEESLVPIADTSNIHPIGAVMEQVDSENDNDITTGPDIVTQVDNDVDINLDRTKKSQISSNKGLGNKHRNTNRLSSRHTYPKNNPAQEPYRLLKPPPPQISRHRNMKTENNNRRRRMNKPKDYKIIRIIKSEPLFSDDSDEESIEPTIPILLKPPPLNAEKRSDTLNKVQTPS